MRKTNSVCLFAATAAALNFMLPTAHASLIYDNISNFENNPAQTGGADDGSELTFIGTNFNPTTGKTSTKFGDNAAGGYYALAAGTTDITGFDLFPIIGITNTSGNIVSSAANNYSGLKMTIYVWGNVNLAGANSSNPAFSNLLGSYTYTDFEGSQAFENGYFYSYENHTSPGSAPGITLPTPITIPSTVGHDSIGEPVIGISYLVQATKAATNTSYAAVNGISPTFTFGSPASVGDAAVPGSGNFNTAFFFNNSNEQTGNFVEGPYQFTGYTDSATALRVFGDVAAVPEPASLSLLALSTVALLGRRKGTRSAV